MQAELKRQQAAAEAKKQKQADKAARKQKKQQAIEHYNSLPEEARQRIRESNKSYKSNRDQYVKDQGIKWYQFSKKSKPACNTMWSTVMEMNTAATMSVKSRHSLMQ